LNTHITYVCEKDSNFSFDCNQILNYDLDISNYPVDTNSLICTDILIFHYTQDYDECLNEITQIRETYQFKPIILIADRFDSKCISWAITQKINNIIILPDELKAFNNLLNHLIENPYHSTPPLDTDTVNEPTIQYAKNTLFNRIECKTSKAIDFIHKNYSVTMQLAKAASLCNMSISTFTRIFKHEQGVTFCQYVQLLRFCVAKKMLRNTYLPISQIAYMCGFNDPAYFTRIFKLAEQLTPKEYRKHLQ
jgi:AraC-like DNA-binding protein